MSVLKYKDPVTGEIKKVGAPSIDAYSKSEIDNMLGGVSEKSTTIDATLLAANWTGDAAPYTYTLSISGVTETSNQEILPALNITTEQLEALQAANIQDGGQAAGSITLKAFGDVPTIDIPIRVIVRGDA